MAVTIDKAVKEQKNRNKRVMMRYFSVQDGGGRESLVEQDIAENL